MEHLHPNNATFDEARSIFSEWAAEQKMSPANLARKTGMSYQHSWALLAGKQKITFHTLAVMLIAFGIEGPAISMASTMRQQWLNSRLSKMEL